MWFECRNLIGLNDLRSKRHLYLEYGSGKYRSPMPGFTRGTTGITGSETSVSAEVLGGHLDSIVPDVVDECIILGYLSRNH